MKPKLTRKSWTSVEEKIRSLNKELFDLLHPIAVELEDSYHSYVYEVSVPFGEQLLVDGKALLLKEESCSRYEFSNELGAERLTWRDFYTDCCSTNDYPFSIVVKNYVEIYSVNKSVELENEDYLFPINVIKEGGCFGTWGVLDVITGLRSNHIAGWHGASGRVCFVPLLKKLQKGKSNVDYRNKLLDILPGEHNDLREELIILFRNRFGEDLSLNTIFYVIPDAFIFNQVNESSELGYNKLKLQHYIFKLAWESVESYRNVFWHFKEINNKNQLIANDLFATSLIQHMNDVVMGKGFGLRPIMPSDGVLYEIQEKLIMLFEEEGILEYIFPGILIYSQKNSQDDKLIVSLNSPAYISFFKQVDRYLIRNLIVNIRLDKHESLRNVKLFNNEKNPKSKFRNCDELKDYLALQYAEATQKTIGRKMDISIHLPEKVNFSALIEI